MVGGADVAGLARPSQAPGAYELGLKLLQRGPVHRSVL